MVAFPGVRVLLVFLGYELAGHASVRSGGCVLAHLDDGFDLLLIEVTKIAFRIICAVANRLGDLSFLGGFFNQWLEVE